jgi:small subunit ribosomal protein S1
MEGEVLLSLDRARGERGWRTLQTLYESGESFEAEITGFNKGGLLVNVEGVAAFVPLSQLVGLRPERSDTGAGLATAVGKNLRLKVIELNRRRNRVILSERGALQEWRTQQKDRLLSELEEGEVRKGRVSSIRSFGVFVDLGGADGLVRDLLGPREGARGALQDRRRSRRICNEGRRREEEDRAEHS